MSNVFRPEYRELSDEEKKLVDDIKTQAKGLHDLYEQILDGTDHPGAGRYKALAKTSIEESVMWAVKAVTGPVMESEEA